MGLQVEDSAGAIAHTTLTVSVATSPIAPTAVAGGPYSFAIGPASTMHLDGTGSVNPDEGLSEQGLTGDTIIAYEWDLDGDGVFDDATGPQPDVTSFFTTLGVGSYLIQLKVTDSTVASFPGSGQPNLTDTDSAGVIVTVAADTTPPVLQLPSGVTAEATSAGGASVVYEATATDDVDGSVTPVCTPASGATFPLGLTSVNCSATDSAGNSAPGSFDVNVVDTTPPQLVAPPDVAVEATGPLTAVVLGTPTATDLVDPSPAVSPSNAGPFAPGTHTITWTAADDYGNAATANQHVTVQGYDTTGGDSAARRPGHGDRGAHPGGSGSGHRDRPRRREPGRRAQRSGPVPPWDAHGHLDGR